jgi:NosR/NirI family nitrous oxide reductase transcriptional regulator
VRPRRSLLAIVTVLAGAVFVAAQGRPADAQYIGHLKALFPSAASFGPKGGQPPHFTAFAVDPAGKSAPPAGFAFWTTELQPLERGYDGPIKILVGMDTAGIISGIVVTEHREPYGYFSVDLPEFADQFKGKSIRDPFKVGVDIDAISRATITVTSATRAVRDSSRRVARQLLTPDAVKR